MKRVLSGMLSTNESGTRAWHTLPNIVEVGFGRSLPTINSTGDLLLSSPADWPIEPPTPKWFWVFVTYIA